MTAREDFEAAVWRVAGRRLHQDDVECILAAADAYAAAEGGITAERRTALSLAAARVYRRRVPCACGCGTTVVTPDEHGRRRRFMSGHNLRQRAGAAA